MAKLSTAPCRRHGRPWILALNPHRYVDQKGSAAMLTSIQSAGVTPEVNLGITQARKHARDPPWL